MRKEFASGKRKPASGISTLEEILWPFLRKHGWHWRLRWTDDWGTFELDFALPDAKLNIEIDGREHAWGKRATRDKRRDAELERRDWRILRIPNAEVADSPRRVARQIKEWAEEWAAVR